jgi:hypothetical protein
MVDKQACQSLRADLGRNPPIKIVVNNPAERIVVAINVATARCKNQGPVAEPAAVAHTHDVQ